MVAECSRDKSVKDCSGVVKIGLRDVCEAVARGICKSTSVVSLRPVVPCSNFCDSMHPPAL